MLEYIQALFKQIKIPPIVSFEGLPGSGKSTQINQLKSQLKQNKIKTAYFELPTNSTFGDYLHFSYSNVQYYQKLRRLEPEMNLIFLLFDLYYGLKEIIRKKPDIILMSRGLLSTYYYNYDLFYSKTQSHHKSLINAFRKLSTILKYFYKPNKIYFLAIDPQIAYERIKNRNKNQFRKMDQLNHLKKDKVILETLIFFLKDSVNIQTLRGELPLKKTTDIIIDDILKHLL